MKILTWVFTPRSNMLDVWAVAVMTGLAMGGEYWAAGMLLFVSMPVSAIMEKKYGSKK